ncbi:MAG TPA: hypothetical protein VFJ06_11290 [Halococcus sp.]|nr:hypothetical protein [Halococcus sp.]
MVSIALVVLDMLRKNLFDERAVNALKEDISAEAMNRLEELDYV